MVDMVLTRAYSIVRNLYYGPGLASPLKPEVNTTKGGHFVYTDK